MKYTIDGGNLPVLKVQLKAGENIRCESGAMSWMDEGISMQTQSGGFGKMLGRLFTNENAFENVYEASKDGEITFSSKFPGSVSAMEITPGNGIIIQKGSYLASFGNIESKVYINKKVGNGLFGGEGFLMRQYTGTGTVFLEIDGSAHEYELKAGETKIIDSGYLAAMSETCTMEIRSIKGVGNVLFGGEGLFNTVITGPGKIILQSMPIASTAMELYQYMPHPSGSSN